MSRGILCDAQQYDSLGGTADGHGQNGNGNLKDSYPITNDNLGDRRVNARYQWHVLLHVIDGL